MTKKMRRVLIVGLVSVIAVALASKPHIVRGLVRGLSIRPLTLDPALTAPTGECLPPWERNTIADYEQMLGAYYQEPIETPVYATDHDGVIMINYGWIGSTQGAMWQYTPLQIGQFGITGMQAWCEDGDLLGFQIADTQGRWLLANADFSPGFPVWRYDFPFARYQLPTGWVSGLGSIYPVVLLSQLYTLTGDERYADTARAAIVGYETPVEEGGYRFEGDGGVWFEEYPAPGVQLTHVLNGHIIAVQGLAYYADHVDATRTTELVREGIATVRDNIHRFDVPPNGQLYDLYRDTVIGSDHYAFKIVVEGLEWMAARTGDNYLAEWASKFRSY